MGTFSALLIALLSFGGFVGVATIVSNNYSGLTPVSFAKDGEDDNEDDNEDEDEDEEEDKDEDEEEDKKSESEKKAKEEAKKKAEREREAAKKAAEQARKSSGSGSDDSDDDMVNGVKLRGDGSVDDDQESEGKEVEDENEVEEEHGDDNGMYKDRTKTLSKLEKELMETEKDILEKQAEGVDVTAALARLAEAKAKLTAVGGAFDSNDLEAAKALSKEVKKLAHFAKEEDLHDAKEVAEDVSKITKRIAQAYGKITLLEAVGGDGSAFRTALATYEADFAALKATIAAGGYDGALMEKSLEMLERKVKLVKSSVEGAIYALGGTDSRLDDDIKDESDDIAEHLNDIADIEDDNVGVAIRGIADDHRAATSKMGEVVSHIDSRNPVLQTLFGADGDDLNALEQEIAASTNRTEALTQAANAVEDAEVKSILLAQIETLKEQTLKLQNFVDGQRDRLSLFGWLFKLGQ